MAKLSEFLNLEPPDYGLDGNFAKMHLPYWQFYLPQTISSAWNGQSPTHPIRLDFGLS